MHQVYWNVSLFIAAIMAGNNWITTERGNNDIMVGNL